ncbi:MAG: T9SS type A sorting domain-containing protein [bacterium]|nr:T9SS type A sorting domain-containing protein [bacterium]
MIRFARFALLSIALMMSLSANAAAPNLSLIGQYHTGVFDAGACEISAFDPTTQRLFVVSAAASSIFILDLSNPASPTLISTINGAPYGASFNSVDVKNGIVAAAVEANPKQNPGVIVFFDTNGSFLNQVPAGALPDMITFTPDGRYVLSANEGEPNAAYTVDPQGSVTIVDLAGGVMSPVVMTASFTSYNGQEASLRAQGIHIFGPNANTSQDLEPEYIAVSANSQTAYVTLQENNALAIIDIPSATVTTLKALGYIDRRLGGNSFDPSDRDNGSGGPAIVMGNWPVYSMYNPDAIASYEVGGSTFLITANEGDVREYSGYTESVRAGAGSYVLDPVVFPNAATLKNNANLGRLNVTTSLGNTDADAQFEAIYTFGGRSFSIWDENGNLVFDSGNQFETLLASLLPTNFNSTNSANQSFDTRSDDKGPEPEGVTIANVCDRWFAFIGCERVGGIFVYDVTNPHVPFYVDYINSRDFSVVVNGANPATLQAVVELGPEGILFVDAADSPNGEPLVILSNEINGSVTVYSAFCDSYLPVEFGDFDAVAGNGEVRLNWNTTAETNNDRFEIVRNGSPVASVASLGNDAEGHNYSWIDRNVENNTVYNYSLISVSLAGEREELATASATPTTSSNLPLEFALNPAYPNPFNPTTSISYSLPEAAQVLLQVFDVNGREVATLVNGTMNAGTHSVTFDAANLSSGIYFTRMNAGSFSASQKLVLMK